MPTYTSGHLNFWNTDCNKNKTHNTGNSVFTLSSAPIYLYIQCMACADIGYLTCLSCLIYYSIEAFHNSGTLNSGALTQEVQEGIFLTIIPTGNVFKGILPLLIIMITQKRDATI